jgi:broad specificity phosphatase PhoE
MTLPRVRTIDLEDPFVASFEGMCEVLPVRHGGQQLPRTSRLAKRTTRRFGRCASRRRKLWVSGSHPRAGCVYCSPLQRVYDTAFQVARHHNLEPIVREDLREIDLWQRAPQDKGLLDLYSREEIARGHLNA